MSIIITEKTFAQEIIVSTTDGTPTTIYTGTDIDIVQQLRMTNVHTADVTVNIWFVPNGGSADVDAFKLYATFTIPKNDFINENVYYPMATGSKFTATCSVANKANIHLSGKSIT